MSTCPICRASLSFPSHTDWYKCPACQGWIRMVRSSSGVRQFEAGMENANGIMPVQIPANASSTNAPRPSAQPRTPEPLRSTTSSVQARSASSSTASPVVPTSTPQARTTNTLRVVLPPEITAMNLERVHAARKTIADELLTLETENQALMDDLSQNYRTPGVSLISQEMTRRSQTRRDLMERNRLLNIREDSIIATQNSQASLRASQSSTSYSSSSSSSNGISTPMGCGISAFLGVVGIIGFTLYMGIQQWEFKTLLIMLGVGIGIALISWTIGKASD